MVVGLATKGGCATCSNHSACEVVPFLASFGQRNDSILRQWLGSQATPELIERVGDAKEAILGFHAISRCIFLCVASGVFNGRVA
jgi:hypothetical protein